MVDPIRQKIIETASKLFYSNGYNRTAINEILEEAGVARNTLYSLFKTKEDLCLAYLIYKNENFIAHLKKFLQEIPGGKMRILGLFDFLKIFFKSDDFNGCWCVNVVSEIPQKNIKIRTEIKKQKKDFILLIESMLNEAYPLNVTETNHGLSKQIYLLYEGAVAESHLHEDKWPIFMAKEMCNNILV